MTKAASVESTKRTSKGLRDTLFKELDRLRNDMITPQKAREVTRVAQQILQSVKLEIEAARFVNDLRIAGEGQTTIPEGRIPIIEL